MEPLRIEIIRMIGELELALAESRVVISQLRARVAELEATKPAPQSNIYTDAEHAK